jgi:hypothetical protein
MSHSTIRSLIGNPALEALELQDFNAPDVTPTQDADAFPPEPEYSPEEEAEMERQYRAGVEDSSARPAAAPAGYVAAACLGCSAALYVPEGGRSGDAPADDDGGPDDDDTPPPAGSPAAVFAASVKAYSDDLLVTAIGMADSGELFPHNPGSRQLWLAAAAAEVLRRLDGTTPRRAA